MRFLILDAQQTTIQQLAYIIGQNLDESASLSLATMYTASTTHMMLKLL